MTSIYLALWWDGQEYSQDYLVCCFIDKEEALKYAARYDLRHGETITVELRYAGICNMIEEVYTRCTYDHTQVLFDLVDWYKYGYDYTLSRMQVIAEAIEQYSPMCVDIDWDRLYTMYREYTADEED